MNDETDLDGELLDSSGIPKCPFCGSAARYFGPLVSGGKPRYLWEIQCRGCHASMQGEGETSEEAKVSVLVRWRQRVGDGRLAILDAWFESRGLPRDWTGPLDVWGWVLFDNEGGVCGYDHEFNGERPPGNCDMMERWDEATPEQRAEALRIEAERSKSAQP